jgi:YebC/PmpR family DNA-binding regulatory protein
MSGHSKWSTIKHKKAREDAKRGKAFTKVIKEISVAARLGGGDPDGNPRLRAAILAAKAVNMPADNVKRAILKGTGELPGTQYEEVTFEGYGPGGAAVLVETMTDNKNRTLPEIRFIFNKNAGNLGENGCVAWMFNKRGFIVIGQDKVSEEKLMDVALNAGADDLKDEGENFEVYTPPDTYEAVMKALEENKIPVGSSELAMLPQTEVKLEGKKAKQMLRLMEALEDHDDVQNVWSNFDIDESELENF